MRKTIKLAPLTLFAVASLLASGSAVADTSIRSGEQVLSQYTEAVKTDNGEKEKRLIKVIYHWDSGTTYSRSYDATGTLIDSQTLQQPPAPDVAEINDAIRIVRLHPEVTAITARQAGIDINGGFPLHAESGVCARPARCIQMFLFDAENVVRHMLVDLRIGKVVDSNYVPPQNRGAAE